MWFPAPSELYNAAEVRSPTPPPRVWVLASSIEVADHISRKIFLLGEGVQQNVISFVAYGINISPYFLTARSQPCFAMLLLNVFRFPFVGFSDLLR